MGKNLTHIVEKVGGSDRCSAQVAATGKGQEALSDRRATAGGRNYRAGEAATLSLSLGPLLDQRGSARDGLEDIVEVVRDASGKLAKRLHFLRLRKLIGEVMFLC